MWPTNCAELLARYHGTPRRSKRMMFVIGAMVRRNMRSRLPSMRQACQGLQTVLDSFAERVMQVPVEKDTSAAAWAKDFWKGVRGKCRGAVARQKRRIKAEQRRLAIQQRAQQEMVLIESDENEGGDHPEHEVMEMRLDAGAGLRPENPPALRAEADMMMEEVEAEGDEVLLMQWATSWVRFLQDDMEYRKSCGEAVGAYVAQLQALLLAEPHEDLEALGYVQALLAAYQFEPADETRPDRADEFARKWMSRLRTLLRRPTVAVVDSQNTVVDDQAGVMVVIEGSKERVLLRPRTTRHCAGQWTSRIRCLRLRGRVVLEMLAMTSGSSVAWSMAWRSPWVALQQSNGCDNEVQS